MSVYKPFYQIGDVVDVRVRDTLTLPLLIVGVCVMTAEEWCVYYVLYYNGVARVYEDGIASVV